MQVDTLLDPVAAPGAAAGLERAGFGCAWVTETVRDPFVVLALATQETTEMMLATGVAIAFARSPMTLAQSAHDVHRLSGGRLILGLGSQVRPHITRRFGMPWSRPAARMREYVLALRAIWAAWNDGAGLDFRGEFSSHTLMTPFFDPGPTGFGSPPVFLGGVGERMTAVAGEVADGSLCGPLTSIDSLRAHTLPALEAGRALSDRAAFTVLTRDPNPIHWDVAAVRALGLGDRPVNQGGLNVGYVIGALTAWAGSGAAVRDLRVRFHGTVRAGDSVTAGGEVVEESGTTATLRVWLRGADGADLLSGTATVEAP